MKKWIILSGISACVIGILAFQNATSPIVIKQTNIDSLAAERERLTQEVLASIKGHEADMANTLFKNVKTLSGKEGIKATHFLAVMNYWGEALGVSCTHCHNTGDWSSDEKPAKITARGMYALRHIINKQISLEVEGLSTVKPLVNCGTCHRCKTIPGE